MKYVVPFAVIRDKFLTPDLASPAKTSKAAQAIPEQSFIDAIKLLLQSVDVDDEWYRNKYPDVADAIDDGVFKSAKHHFVEAGYFEGRLPAEIHVDETWYADQYPDVAEGVKTGAIPSITHHFRDHGYAEGRRPFAL